ncbi:MAG: Gamma-glutamyl phosphate reductase [Candidatus Magasanikbacteria bacterium GW2011_GWD2_43_18]|nr:MAG: Gamma-glutamyl phosphate reductase [Candidatus Magasanikbacteria bacterium GW2011_GWC2_42_27]KKT03893.1 MAG: Gamma-glutamyl phosphate reductase [Candidatus Magasanikbacteria bacterium GW2011_GWD2_43_18]KKT25753.1 MAG: Gamma-glutamyl phosphate reductase [Candidatus Magasanikbacteria bacterium GW2011_GWA2_43_9]
MYQTVTKHPIGCFFLLLLYSSMKTEQKNNVLTSLATLLREQTDAILHANTQDLDNASDMDTALRERLALDATKIQSMITSIHTILTLPDPEQKIISAYTHDNGLVIKNMTVTFGTILIIYESRPDVTIEASALAFKAGNTVLLKGGKESLHTNLALIDLWHKALSIHDIDTSYVTYLDMDRDDTQSLIANNTHDVDLIIPRGGEGLISFVETHASVPVLVSGRGNNFLYLDSDADIDMAIDIIKNGKSRISVCNALDKVLINEQVSDEHIRMITSTVHDAGIALLGDEHIVAIDERVMRVEDMEAILKKEFLSATLFLHVVDTLDTAIYMINTYSGGHSASIVSNNAAHADTFQQQVDCAAVYHNASSRFTDGGQFGLGGEIAISTQKLHCRGPIGLDSLVTNKWFITGTGQIR